MSGANTVVLTQQQISQNDGRTADREKRDTGLPVWKRAFDLVTIIFLLPGVFLMAVAVALIVKLGSRGPVLFRQTRIGYKGRPFTCYKFRTMTVNSDASSHRGHTTELIRKGEAMTKLDAGHDPRVIPLGGSVRATGLDELPQLLNVLRGEMSIVGPRPCIPYEYELYEPWQRRRFDAVPGLTGLWQVSGKNRTTFNQMIHLDIEYAQRKSPLLDFWIVLRTLPAICTQCADMIEKKSRNKAATESRPVDIAKPIHT